METADPPLPIDKQGRLSQKRELAITVSSQGAARASFSGFPHILPNFKSEDFMQNESSILEKAGETVGFAQQYIEKRIELYRLELTEKVVITLSSLIASFFLLSIFGLVLIFGSISVGFYLAAAIGSYGLAFLIVTIFYALMALILYIFKQQLILHPILRRVIDLFREEEK